MKAKIELKAALDALQVRKPLRLPSSAPAFTPPAAPTPVQEPTPVGNPTGVDNATPVEKTTGVRNPTEAGKQTPVADPTPVAKATPVDSETPVRKTTQVANPTPVENPTPVGNQTPVSNPTEVEKQTQGAKPAPVENHTGVVNPTQVNDEEHGGGALSRRVTEQDSSVVLEARATDGLERGYTRLPNAILIRLASGDFTRNEIKLALLIARFTISFQRKQAPLSKTVLARRADLREAAVLEAISGLVSKGLVEKQQGDQNRPNLLGLVLPPDWDQPTKPRRELKETQVEKPTPVGNQTPVAFPGPAPVGNPTPAGVVFPTPFKDTSRYSNSLSALPESLQKYFDDLKPAKKRESEWKAFEELKTDYTAEDIADCATILQTRGIVRRGPNGEESQQCHSPMAYLSKAMGEVFAEVEARRQKTRERAEREQREAEIEHQRRETEAREAAEWAEKERAFANAFPSEERQHEALMDMLRGLPFRANSAPGRIMGIGKWWDGLKESERVELKG